MHNPRADCRHVWWVFHPNKRNASFRLFSVHHQQFFVVASLLPPVVLAGTSCCLLHLATFLWLAGEKLLVWAVVFECQWKKWCAFEYFDLCQNPIVFFVEAVRGQRWILKWIEFTVTSKQTCLYQSVNWRGENWIHHLRSWMMADGSEAVKGPISLAPGFLASSRHPLSRAQLPDWCSAWSEQCPVPHPNGACSTPLRGVGKQAGGVLV